MFVFFILAMKCVGLSHSQTETGSLFIKKTATVCGPNRIGPSSIERSLVQCGSYCLGRYKEQCYTFMYNEITKLCTPGGKLAPFLAPPNTTEGQLYIVKNYTSYSQFNYTTFNSSYGQLTQMYAYYKTDLTYAEAVAMCQCLDSRLYVARNLSKLEFIIQSAVSAGRATWIGLDDIVQEGQFVWIDGQLFDWTYRNNYFIPGRPDDYMQSQDCCVVDLGSRLLDDISCYSQFSFICEKV